MDDCDFDCNAYVGFVLGGERAGRFTIYRQAHDWHKQSEPTYI